MRGSTNGMKSVKSPCLLQRATNIGGGNKCPSPESTSGTDGASAVKKTKTQHRFTRVEKTFLEERQSVPHCDGI